MRKNTLAIMAAILLVFLLGVGFGQISEELPSCINVEEVAETLHDYQIVGAARNDGGNYAIAVTDHQSRWTYVLGLVDGDVDVLGRYPGTMPVWTRMTESGVNMVTHVRDQHYPLFGGNSGYAMYQDGEPFLNLEHVLDQRVPIDFWEKASRDIGSPQWLQCASEDCQTATFVWHDTVWLVQEIDYGREAVVTLDVLIQAIEAWVPL